MSTLAHRDENEFHTRYSLEHSKRLYLEYRRTSEIIYEICFLFFFSLVIRGDKEERTVLCSGDKTYDLKIADTSNLLLFVPGCKTPDQLTDSQNGPHVVHTQVCECRPDILQNIHNNSLMYLCVQQLNCNNYYVVFLRRSGDFLTATGN